jgi:TatA/E family protein of Tat protein translocase
MLGIGVQELMLILFIVLILFGAKRVPELAKGLGKAISEFKKAANDIGIDDAIASESKMPAARSVPLADDKSDELPNKA